VKNRKIGKNMREKLNKKDYLFIAVCVVIAAITCFVSLKFYNQAFPEASLDFEVRSGEAKDIASEFLQGMDIDISDYRYASRFRYDNEAKVFLEREVGLERANKLLGEKIKIWKWSNRWFKPLQKEEFKVDISPAGEVIGFVHLLEEEKEGSYLSEKEARLRAIEFLEKIRGKSGEYLEFVESDRIERENRLDWTFTWKQKEMEIENATYRYQMKISGGTVTGYSEYLKIPEEWERGYSKLRSLNRAAGSVDSFLIVLIAIAVLVIFIRRIRLKIMEIKFSIVFGAVAFVLSLLASLNSFSNMFYFYETTQSLGGFVSGHVFSIILSSLISGIAIFLLTAVGESYYREHFRKKISVKNIFSFRALSTKRFFISNVLGLTLAFFFICYQIVFYIVASKLGAWSPADVPYSDMLNTKFPWLFVLLVGFFPAVSEEFLFRMFAIPFLKKIFRFTWIALVVAGFLWGFGHSTYPNQPFFIRGLEVGLAGILIGYLMIKFNIFAVFIWHYTIDAFYTAFLLFRSHNPYFALSGGIAAGLMFIPLLLSIIKYVKSRGFEPDEKMLNEQYEEQVPVEEHAVAKIETTSIPYRNLSLKRIGIAILCVIILSGIYFIKVEGVGEKFHFRIGKKKAMDTSTRFLESRQVDTSSFMQLVYPKRNFEPVEAKYIMEKGGVHGVNRMLNERFLGPEWRCRYFKPLAKDEFIVSINPMSGKVSEFVHKIEEDREGDFLEEDEAEKLAYEFLGTKGIDNASVSLKESSSEDRKNRRDYHFVFEKKKGNIEEAKQRLEIRIAGSEISEFSREIKIPESYKRERNRRTAFSVLLMVIKIGTAIFFIAYAIFFFISRFSDAKAIRKKLFFASIAITVLSLLDRINRIPELLIAYDTSIPLNVYYISVGFGTLLLPIAVFIITFFALHLIFTVKKQAISVFTKTNVRRLFSDGLIVTIISVAILFVLTHLWDILCFHFSHLVQIGGFSIPYAMGAYLPFYSNLFSNILKSIIVVAGLVVFIEVLTKYLKKHYQKLIAILFVLIAFIPETVRGSDEYLFYFLVTIGLGAVILVVVKFLFRDNFLAYPLAIFTSLMVLGIVKYIFQPAPSIQINGYILILFFVLPFMALFYRGFKGSGLHILHNSVEY
jgi:membrane protease YdiL (CAAX protease family)